MIYYFPCVLLFSNPLPQSYITAPGLLMNQSGSPFTVFDAKDQNINRTANCPTLSQGGFWFDHCYLVNPNAAYRSEPPETAEQWLPNVLGAIRSSGVVGSMMAIKPVDGL